MSGVGSLEELEILFSRGSRGLGINLAVPAPIGVAFPDKDDLPCPQRCEP